MLEVTQYLNDLNEHGGLPYLNNDDDNDDDDDDGDGGEDLEVTLSY